MSDIARMGKRGTLVIPAALRRQFGLTEGCEILADATEEGILLRPAMTLPLEVYSAERKAGFILSNAVDEADYLLAREKVKEMGLDPEAIPHEPL